MNALMGGNKQSSGHGGGSNNLVGQLAGSLLGGGKQSHGSSGHGSSGGGNLVGQLAGSLLGGGKQHGSSSGGQSSNSGHGSSGGGLGGLLGGVLGGGQVRDSRRDMKTKDLLLTFDSNTSQTTTMATATAQPPAEHTPAPHRHPHTTLEANPAATAAALQASPAIRRLRPASSMDKEATASHSTTSTTSTAETPNTNSKDTDRKLALEANLATEAVRPATDKAHQEDHPADLQEVTDSKVRLSLHIYTWQS